jgi:hypothetical protein
MKVNLSYSVELDEVLGSCAALYARAKQKFEQDYNVLTAAAPPEFTLPKLQGAIGNLTSLHQALGDMANKLEEIQGIMMGYRQVLTQQAAPTPPSETPPVEEDE